MTSFVQNKLFQLTSLVPHGFACSAWIHMFHIASLVPYGFTCSLGLHLFHMISPASHGFTCSAWRHLLIFFCSVESCVTWPRWTARELASLVGLHSSTSQNTPTPFKPSAAQTTALKYLARKRSVWWFACELQRERTVGEPWPSYMWMYLIRMLFQSFWFWYFVDFA